METSEPLENIGRQLGLIAGSETSLARQMLVDRVNYLILHDFEQLVSALYRLDVSEKKIAELLQTYPQEDAALVITDLMLLREAEKIESRREWGGKEYDEKSGEEKW